MGKHIRSKWILFTVKSLIVVVALTLSKFCWNTMLGNPLNYDSPTGSIIESQRKGVFICSVRIDADVFLWKSERATVNEMWIEHKAKENYPFIWFPTLKLLPGYYLCFNVSGGGPEEFTDNDPLFTMMVGQESETFGRLSRRGSKVVFFTEIEQSAFAKGSGQMRLRLIDHDSGAQAFQLSWQPK